MVTITQNRFDGGIADDKRSQSSVEIYNALNFDLQSNPNRATPLVNTEAEAMTSGDIKEKRVSDMFLDDNGNLVFAGRNGNASPTVIDLIAKDDTEDITSTMTSFTTLSGVSLYVKNSVATYQNKTFLISGDNHIRTYDGSWTDLGATGTSNWAEMGQAKPYRHLADDLLYISQRNLIMRTNTGASPGTSFSTYFTFSTRYVVTSMTNYGSDLAVSISPMYSGHSYLAILDRISTNTSPRNLIDWGAGSLAIVENIQDVIIGVSTNEVLFTPTTTFSSAKTKKIFVKAYSGGSVEIIKEITVPSTVKLKQLKFVRDNKLYFGCDNDDALYCVRKNKSGVWVVNKEHYIANGEVITNLQGFAFAGDYLFTMYDTAGDNGFLSRTNDTNTYTSSSVIETLINPNMSLSDRSKKKQLKSFSISKASTTGSASIYYSVDGSSYVLLGTTADTETMVLKGINEASGTPLASGYEFQFKLVSTGGAEIVEYKYEYENVPELI